MLIKNKGLIIMKKFNLVLAITSAIMSGNTQASDLKNSDEKTIVGASSKVLGSYEKIATAQIKKEATKAVITFAEEMIPGAKVAFGVTYGLSTFYSGTEEKKEEGEGKLARTIGENVKYTVENYIPSGATIVDIAQKLKPEDCETFSEGIVKAFTPKSVSQIRTNGTNSQMAGDTAKATVELLPGGKYITATTGGFAQYCWGEETKTLSEGVLNTTYNLVGGVGNMASSFIFGNIFDEGLESDTSDLDYGYSFVSPSEDKSDSD